ncbi:hypothetical protein V8G54_001723 [Vigna mungo]|uniref:Uncharacterized protein n=1 Tax=Vigna mungo TaxID=3915 RepID=A0AAQ3SC35_VIGMU
MKFLDWYLKIGFVSVLVGASMEVFMIKAGFCLLGEARDSKLVISNRPFSLRDRVKRRPRKPFEYHGKNDNGLYHLYYLKRYGTLAIPLTSFWRRCRGLKDFVPNICRMQFGQAFDYMGTQSYQNNFDHWWEPHSYMDQKGQQPSLKKETLWEAEQRLQDEQISYALRSLGIIGVNTKVDPRKECQCTIFEDDEVIDEEKIDEDEITNALISLGIIGVNTEINPREECQAIIFKDDKVIDEEKIEEDEITKVLKSLGIIGSNTEVDPREEAIDEEKIEEDEITKTLKSVGIIGGNTEVDPKEEYQVTIFENDKLSEGEKNEEKEEEVRKLKEKTEKKRKKGKKKILYEKPLPHQRKKRKREKKKRSDAKPLPHQKKYHGKEKKFKCFIEILKKLEIEVPMIDTWKHVLGVLNFVKKFSRKKRKKRISSEKQLNTY